MAGFCGSFGWRYHAWHLGQHQHNPVHVTQIADSGLNDGRLQVKISGVQMFTWIPGIAGTYNAAPVVATMPLQSRGATN